MASRLRGFEAELKRALAGPCLSRLSELLLIDLPESLFLYRFSSEPAKESIDLRLVRLFGCLVKLVCLPEIEIEQTKLSLRRATPNESQITMIDCSRGHLHRSFSSILYVPL